MSDDDRRAQADALLEEIARSNACIREAIDNDNPLLLDNCPGVDAPWANSFRALLNGHDYGCQEPLGSMLPVQDEDAATDLLREQLHTACARRITRH